MSLVAIALPLVTRPPKPVEQVIPQEAT
jgi:hypothetical protein